MKKPIIASIVAVAIMVLANLLGMIQTHDYSIRAFFYLAVQFLIIHGIVNKHRLAWQWGRVLMLLGSIGVLLITMVTLSQGHNVSALVTFFFIGIPAMVIFISFGTSEAREHFSVICPACSSKKIKANDFLFNEAKCIECKHVW